EHPGARVAWRRAAPAGGGRRLTIQAVTIDFWGTLVIDGPGADERYRVPRMRAWRQLLADAGIDVSPAALAAAYDRSMSTLHDVWREHRDVDVSAHVDAILTALDPTIASRLDSQVLTKLRDAYATPLSVVPPAFDSAAEDVLRSLRARGY